LLFCIEFVSWYVRSCTGCALWQTLSWPAAILPWMSGFGQGSHGRDAAGRTLSGRTLPACPAGLWTSF